MYLDTPTKFYEIFKKQADVYIHYGRLPSMTTQLPFGSFLLYNFPNAKDAKLFYDKQLEAKQKKGYIVQKKEQTSNMTWMRKNAKPKIKTKNAKKTRRKSQ